MINYVYIVVNCVNSHIRRWLAVFLVQSVRHKSELETCIDFISPVPIRALPSRYFLDPSYVGIVSNFRAAHKSILCLRTSL